MDGMYADCDFGFAQRCSLEDHRPAPEAFFEAAAAGPHTQTFFEAAAAGPHTQTTAEALRLARSCATDGTAAGTMQALELITDILRAQGGEKAVLDALRSARENHQRVQMSATRPGPNWVLAVPAGTCEQLETSNAILASCGRQRVIVDAASDGSSTMCPACGALVARERWHAHVQHWCPSLHTHQDEDMEMEEDRAAIPLYLFQPSL